MTLRSYFPFALEITQIIYQLLIIFCTEQQFIYKLALLSSKNPPQGNILSFALPRCDCHCLSSLPLITASYIATAAISIAPATTSPPLRFIMAAVQSVVTMASETQNLLLKSATIFMEDRTWLQNLCANLLLSQNTLMSTVLPATSYAPF